MLYLDAPRLCRGGQRFVGGARIQAHGTQCLLLRPGPRLALLVVVSIAL